MYTPPSFAETDRDKLLAAVREYSFATIVSGGDGDLVATHMPLLLETNNDNARLVGHWAKANRQWNAADGQRVLAIFSGPHAYISPTWYAAPNTVPTWNYVAVHVYGTLRVEHDS